MEKDFDITKEGAVLTVVLGAELSVTNAPLLQEELTPYKEQGIKKLVFDATRLTYLSSSGVRVVLYCKKFICSNIVIMNCHKDVLDVLDIVGIRSFLTFVTSE